MSGKGMGVRKGDEREKELSEVQSSFKFEEVKEPTLRLRSVCFSS